MRAIVYKAKKLFGQKWRFRILAANGQTIASSEAYFNRQDAWDTAAQLVGENNVKLVE